MAEVILRTPGGAARPSTLVDLALEAPRTPETAFGEVRPATAPRLSPGVAPYTGAKSAPHPWLVGG
jgi:hypothetical protein